MSFLCCFINACGPKNAKIATHTRKLLNIVKRGIEMRCLARFFVLVIGLFLFAACKTSLFSELDQGGKEEKEKIGELLTKDPGEAIKLARRVLEKRANKIGQAT